MQRLVPEQSQATFFPINCVLCLAFTVVAFAKKATSRSAEQGGEKFVACARAPRTTVLRGHEVLQLFMHGVLHLAALGGTSVDITLDLIVAHASDRVDGQACGQLVQVV